MPGNTNNTNLLDGVNQLILALNELTTATSGQNLDPTINVASPTVNFDTASIVTELGNLVSKATVSDAAIVPQLSSIKDNLLDIATDTDGLGNLLQIAGNSDHLTHLQQLPILATGQGTANTHFANIADRLAPDGESIQPTLLLLIDAMEAQLIDRATVSELPTKITTYAADPKKCEYARRATGYAVKQIYYWKRNWGLAKAMAVTEIAMTAILSGGLFTAAAGASLQFGVELVFHWGQAEIDDFYSEYTALGDDLICAIYSAANASDAITAYKSVVDGATWSGGQTAKDLVSTLFIPINPINYVFSNPTYLLPKAQAGLELDDWSTFDCSTCTPPVGTVQCLRSSVMVLGSPDAFATGDTPADGVYDSELAGDHYVEMNFSQWTDVTITAFSNNINTIYFRKLDCTNSSYVPDLPYTAVDLPVTLDCGGFYIKSAEAAFDVALTFAPNTSYTGTGEEAV